MISDTVKWLSEHNGISVDASMDVRIHPDRSTSSIVLILPGVDGSVDGYQDKYVYMADRIITTQHKAVIRVSNYFISSFHWEDNFKKAIEYILSNRNEFMRDGEISIEVVAHSAGASIAARIAYEYSEIKSLLLINIALKLDFEKIKTGLEKFNGTVWFVSGSQDPSIENLAELENRGQVKIIEGADHDFSGNFLDTFINLPDLLNH